MIVRNSYEYTTQIIINSNLRMKIWHWKSDPRGLLQILHLLSGFTIHGSPSEAERCFAWLITTCRFWELFKFHSSVIYIYIHIYIYMYTHTYLHSMRIISIHLHIVKEHIFLRKMELLKNPSKVNPKPVTPASNNDHFHPCCLLFTFVCINICIYI